MDRWKNGSVMLMTARDPNEKDTPKNIALRRISCRAGVVTAAVAYSMFFFSDDKTLDGLNEWIRLGLVLFFLGITSLLGWKYFKDKNLS